MNGDEQLLALQDGAVAGQTSRQAVAASQPTAGRKIRLTTRLGGRRRMAHTTDKHKEQCGRRNAVSKADSVVIPPDVHVHDAKNRNRKFVRI